ncbi:hypothetical protein SDRG_05930 [Saprolegnia diclina VS20]|uniref:Uncharacterized protein n=1 Tax=Saprolegnia diclina (strain VS20) TaxID=1156394 RepID=T0QP43_SAPDV|nr:hypothetical protein SDRG_05930 [Saprolegnia diclina VS20]EQC36476.1 hypothetical protein SDRG_05930 [Saprolegnia diclina VS20]|eukprot:XP_008609897.1 hypothetical protein SDRG_05930 [Saprolegnia diclina VS20]
MFVLTLINGLCNVFVLGCVRAYASWRPAEVPVRHREAKHLLSAASDAFFGHANADVWSVSPALGCMSGLLTFEWRGHKFLFDTKLWLFFCRVSTGPRACVPSEAVVREAAPTEIAVGAHTRTSKTMVVAGIIYVACSVAGSLSYLQLSSVNLANDMFWVTFNSTGMQSYVANWYNQYVWLTPKLQQHSCHHL